MWTNLNKIWTFHNETVKMFYLKDKTQREAQNIVSSIENDVGFFFFALLIDILISHALRDIIKSYIVSKVKDYTGNPDTDTKNGTDIYRV